jgi:hypothetical protein
MYRGENQNLEEDRENIEQAIRFRRGGKSIEQVIRGKENKNQITHTELGNWQFAEVYVGEEGGKKERKHESRHRWGGRWRIESEACGKGRRFLFCFRLHHRRGRKELLVPGKQEPPPPPQSREEREIAVQRGPGSDWIG